MRLRSWQSTTKSKSSCGICPTRLGNGSGISITSNRPERPGKSYGVQRKDTLDAPWRTDAVVTATTTQKRLVFSKPIEPIGQTFCWVILAL
ncbi:MAG: hypothetical protein FJ404_01290 [Verrucomicrobia bacterium]|nr:hypothetical protein [Verrucomicrobiota bacterium]